MTDYGPDWPLVHLVVTIITLQHDSNSIFKQKRNVFLNNNWLMPTWVSPLFVLLKLDYYFEAIIKGIHKLSLKGGQLIDILIFKILSLDILNTYVILNVGGKMNTVSCETLGKTSNQKRPPHTFSFNLKSKVWSWIQFTISIFAAPYLEKNAFNKALSPEKLTTIAPSTHHATTKYQSD